MTKLSPLTSLVRMLPRYQMREEQLYPDHLQTSWHPPAEAIDQPLRPLPELYAKKADLGSTVGIQLKKQRHTSLPRVPPANATTAVSTVLKHQNALKSTICNFCHEPLNDLPSRLPNYEGPQTYRSRPGYDDCLAVGTSDHAFSNQSSAYQHDLVQQKHFFCTNCYTVLSSGYSRVDEMYLSSSDDLPERGPSIQNTSSELCFSMEWKPEQLASK
jgi:hypothetical protein